MNDLANFNTKAAAAHLGALILSVWGFNHFQGTIKSLTLKRDQLDPEGTEPGQCVLDYGVKYANSGSIRFDYAIYIFFLISFLAHAFYATNGRYRDAVSEGWNPYRWVEYAFSAGTMTAILAPADGTRNVAHVATLAVITGALQFCGLIVESCLKYSAGSRNNTAIYASTFIGWILVATVFGSIFFNFYNLKRDIDQYNGDGTYSPPVELPRWLWFILGSQFVYYSMFGINQIWHIRQKVPDFMSIEKNYIKLSFLSKITLAAGFAYGLIYRTRDC